jgi:xanthine dehydrogenase YagT iron-sulfur-binding subunit
MATGNMLGEAAAGWPSAASASMVPVTGPVTLDATEIRERMSGNLCRRGAYVNIVAAILDVAGETR